jgi:hypothetical protein
MALTGAIHGRRLTQQPCGRRKADEMKMKAKLPKESVSNGRNYGNDKEMVDTFTLAVVKNGEIDTPVTCRAYMGRSRNANIVYASIWVHAPNGHHYAGHGGAGGYGYHKVSEAIQDAITNAGIRLYGTPYNNSEVPDMSKECSIGGVGESAVRNAMEAIARACGYRGKVKFI